MSNHREESGSIDGRPTRRSFLKRTALATGATTGVLAGASVAGAATKLPTLPYQNDPNWVRFHFQNIIDTETTHLSSILNELGTYARPKPTFQNIKATTLVQYVQMGSLFCSTGAGAYLGAAPLIDNPFLFLQAGSIGQVELTQAGYLNTLLDQTFLPGGSPFAPPLTLQQILDRVSPYIANLNGGPAPGFSLTDKSVANDIAIFNTALILEYLEVEFYTSNFSNFFSY